MWGETDFAQDDNKKREKNNDETILKTRFFGITVNVICTNQLFSFQTYVKYKNFKFQLF